MSRIYVNPPPLPSALSERLQKSIDVKTGCCVFHPKIRLCELANDEQRWIVRRKICFQCGSRPGSMGKHYMPGKSIKNPSNVREDSCRASASSRSSRSSRESRSSRSSGSFDSWLLSCCDFLIQRHCGRMRCQQSMTCTYSRTQCDISLGLRGCKFKSTMKNRFFL